MQKFRGMSAAAAAIQKSGLPRSLWRSCGSLPGMTKNKKDRAISRNKRSIHGTDKQNSGPSCGAWQTSIDTILQVGKDVSGQNLINAGGVTHWRLGSLSRVRVLDNNIDYDARTAAEAAGQGHPQRGGAGHRHEVRAVPGEPLQAQGEAHPAGEAGKEAPPVTREGARWKLTFRTAGIGDLELLTESRLRAIRTYRHLSETAALPHGLPDAVRDYYRQALRPAATLRFWRWRESGWPPPAAWTSAGRCPPITIPRVCPAIS